MIILTETGTLEQNILGVFEDREHALAAVASDEPTAEHVRWVNSRGVEYEWITYQSSWGTEQMIDITEVELDQYYV
jgi:hypothetical protein